MRLALWATLTIACVAATVGHAQSQLETRPNVVLIITDDLGWADLGSYGATDIRTPNLDRLAREGLRLTDFYANGVTCSPTRAGLISGATSSATESRCRWRTPPAPAIAARPPRVTRCRNCSRTTATPPGSSASGISGSTLEKSPKAHGFDYFFGFKSGYHRLLHTSRRRRQPDLWENDTDRGPTAYTDGPRDRSRRDPVHRASTRASRSSWTSLTRRRIGPIRCPANRPWRRTTRCCRLPQDDNATTRADYVRHGRGSRSARSANSLPSLERAGAREQHDRDLHERQRRRVAVEQRAAVRPQVDRVGGRHSRSGHRPLARTDPGRAASPIRSASRWISPRRFSRSRARRARRREARGRRSIPGVGGTCAAIRADAVLALGQWSGQTNRRAARGLEDRRRRLPHLRIQPAQRSRRAQRPRKMAPGRRAGSSIPC